MPAPSLKRRITPVLPSSATASAVRELTRAALFFILADSLFGGFGTAYVFTKVGLRGVLLFMAGWQVVSTVAYVLNVYQFQRSTRYAGFAYFCGVSGLLGSIALTGLTDLGCSSGLAGMCENVTLAGVFLLGLVGGASRGVAFSSRTWLELHHTSGSIREAYLARTEAAGTLLRLIVPTVAAALLSWSHNDFSLFFSLAGGTGFLLCLLLLQVPTTSPAVRPVRPWTLLRDASYWRTGPFYVVDGAGHALRTGLFVSGAMAVVGSAQGYGMVEAGASLCAAALLWHQATRPKDVPSLGLLRACMGLLTLGWCALMAALYSTWLLPLFIAAYALGHPMMTVVKSGLTLKGLAQKGVAPQDNLIGRMLLLTLGRVSALGLAWALSYLATEPRWQLALTCVLATALLPLDYLYARRLAHDG